VITCLVSGIMRCCCDRETSPISSCARVGADICRVTPVLCDVV